MTETNGEAPKKAGKADMEGRVDMAARLLARRCTKGQVKRRLARKYGIGARACEGVISRARERLAEETRRSKAEHRTDAYAMFVEVIGRSRCDRDRVRAQLALMKLLGLDRDPAPDGPPPRQVEFIECDGASRRLDDLTFDERALAILAVWRRLGLRVIGPDGEEVTDTRSLLAARRQVAAPPPAPRDGPGVARAEGAPPGPAAGPPQGHERPAPPNGEGRLDAADWFK
jgi:hypothetical protein